MRLLAARVPVSIKFTTAMFKLCQNLKEFRSIDYNILLALICKVVFFLQRRLGIFNMFAAVKHYS